MGAEKTKKSARRILAAVLAALSLAAACLLAFDPETREMAFGPEGAGSNDASSLQARAAAAAGRDVGLPSGGRLRRERPSDGAGSLLDPADPTRFANPGVDLDKTVSDRLTMLDPRRARPAKGWPEQEDPALAPAAAETPGEISAQWIGHATVLVRIDGCAVLTDPIWSDAAGWRGTIGVPRSRSAAVALGSLPRIDVVLVSHDHYDHLDVPTLRRLSAQDGGPPTILTGLGNAERLSRWGIPGAAGMDWWDRAEFSEHPCSKIRFDFVPARHWSKRGLLDLRRTLWGGFRLQGPSGSVFFAGDTGYGPHFQEVRERLGGVDLALLPIGAFEPEFFMRPQHASPEDSVHALLDLGARKGMGIHFATFRMAEDALDAPRRGVLEWSERLGGEPGRFFVPGPGSILRTKAGSRP